MIQVTSTYHCRVCGRTNIVWYIAEYNLALSLTT